MKREDFYFDSRDGETRIHAVKWIPEKKPRCVVQIVHGMAEYASRYEGLAEALTAEGIVVAGEDHLGHGQSVRSKTGQGEHPLGYFCARDAATVVVRDVHRLKKLVQEQYPGVPYLILGHSMGSFILRNYLCRYGTGIDGAAIMGTGMQPRAAVAMARGLAGLIGALGGAKRPSRLLDRMAFGTYNRRIPQPSSDMDWLSRDGEQVRRYLDDPLCGFTFTANGFHTLFTLIGRLYDPGLLENMPKDLPVLFLAGEEDPVGDYGKAVSAVADSFRALGMKRVECRLYPGMRHELVNVIGRQEVEKDLLEWIERTIRDSARVRSR